MAKLFCQQGAKVVIADIQHKLGQALTHDIGHELASYVQCDVTKEFDVENAINIAISKHQKLDIMVNNAATMDEAKPHILDHNLQDFERVIRVNLIGAFLGTKGKHFDGGKCVLHCRRGWSSCICEF